ncbi:unnamed protein product [Prorocentrum cordatum]|uniref:Uncharacterized protein n=1 Tax=Prorocentrum cordatum TaxID=2364126 RepID=A0ABN9PND2_9DINO|nr:unnamed protein product [Polarella glacialis]
MFKRNCLQDFCILSSHRIISLRAYAGTSTVGSCSTRGSPSSSPSSPLLAPSSRRAAFLNPSLGPIRARRLLNVLLTGGLLGFSLGWHFGWNITMGNVLGLSTSGIPISATFVSVAPHPEKQHLHGGVFGPEGGVVSPAAYLLGVLLLALLYGWPRGDLAALPG